MKEQTKGRKWADPTSGRAMDGSEKSQLSRLRAKHRIHKSQYHIYNVDYFRQKGLWKEIERKEDSCAALMKQIREMKIP